MIGLWALIAGQANIAEALPASSLAAIRQNNIIVSNDTSIVAKKPYYAIAHHVLTAAGVNAALRDGANALEVDLHAWPKQGWYADHDGKWWSSGDKAKDLFTHIANQRTAGKTITFVWFDIKSPDYCDPNNSATRFCSIDELRDMARAILQPAGIRVLYGFEGTNYKYDVYKRIANNLNSNEAVDLDGEYAAALNSFGGNGPSGKNERVFSSGLFDPSLPIVFGKLKSKLTNGVASGKFQKVFGWTISYGQAATAEVLTSTGVDGLIYGHANHRYRDNKYCKASFGYLKDAVARRSSTLYLATNSDLPW